MSIEPTTEDMIKEAQGILEVRLVKTVSSFMDALDEHIVSLVMITHSPGVGSVMAAIQSKTKLAKNIGMLLNEINQPLEILTGVLNNKLEDKLRELKANNNTG